MFFESVVREDRSVLDLLNADYTYLNERLANHYGIAHVYGERQLSQGGSRQPDRERVAGCSAMAACSWSPPTPRTSPVIRGKWILDNILGVPPPPPPANVAVVERQHCLGKPADPPSRWPSIVANAACAQLPSAPHRSPGFFPWNNSMPWAAGICWMKAEPKSTRSAVCPDGSQFAGVAGTGTSACSSVQICCPHADRETIHIFALNGPARRGIRRARPFVKSSALAPRASDYRFSSLIVGLTTSTPFQMRKSP